MTELVNMLFGSHVYGTSTPESDRDEKSVFIPDARDILMQRAPRTSVNTTTKQVEIRSLGSCWIWQGGTAGGNRLWDTGGPYGKLKVEGFLR